MVNPKSSPFIPGATSAFFLNLVAHTSPLTTSSNSQTGFGPGVQLTVEAALPFGSNSLWISLALVLAVGLGAHVARDLVEEPRGALLLQYPVARHELVDGGDGRRDEEQQQETLKEGRRAATLKSDSPLVATNKSLHTVSTVSTHL